MGKLLEALLDEPDFEWLMIDDSHCKVHSRADVTKGGNQGMGRTEELNSKMHLAVDVRMYDLPVKVLIQFFTLSADGAWRQHDTPKRFHSPLPCRFAVSPFG